MDSTARRLLVAEGKTVGGRGFEEIGYSLGADVKVRDVLQLFHAEAYLGTT